MLVKPDQKLNPAQAQIKEFAEALDIPTTGVTLLGGKPYVNKIGLLHKAHQIGLQSITAEQLSNANENENMTAGYKAYIDMKDGSHFEAEGWGSPKSIQMKTLHNPDFINMTTETRAKNRALGLATGYGYVSAEEIQGEIIDTIEADYQTEENQQREESNALSSHLNEETTTTPPPIQNESIKTDKQEKRAPEMAKPVGKEEINEVRKDCLKHVNEDTFAQIAEKIGLKGKKLSEYKQSDLVNLLQACKEHAQNVAHPKPKTETIAPFPINDEGEQDAELEPTQDTEE